MTAALEDGEWSAARPGRTLPSGKTRYPLYGRLDGPQGRSRRVENLVPTGIRSRTFQPAVSRYTDWATGPTNKWCKGVTLSGKIQTLSRRHCIILGNFGLRGDSLVQYVLRPTYLETYTDNSVSFGGTVSLSGNSLLLRWHSALRSGCWTEVSRSDWLLNLMWVDFGN